MKALIGYDGSSFADAALADLHKAGLPAETEILLLSVGEVWLPPPPSYALLDTDFAAGPGAALREAEAVAAAGRDKVLAAFPTWTVVAEARTGSPARQLLEVASAWHPDLIVVGSRGRTGLAKFFLGSVSQTVVSEATCSVRIARGRLDEPDEPVRIVIGVDGSHGADAAVRAVAGRTWPKGSHARLVTAFGPLSIDGHELQGELDRVRGLHAVALERLQGSGLEVTSAIHGADPRELVVREADEWGADCIFLGATGLLTLERFLFGTVAAAVTARAQCSVEVVRKQL
jgi:nucleotide-binding universal stress UspA family protein